MCLTAGSQSKEDDGDAHASAKPGLPAILLFGLAFWASVALSLCIFHDQIEGRCQLYGFIALLIAGSVALGAMLFALRGSPRRATVLFILSCALLGSCLGSVRLQSYESLLNELPTEEAHWRFELLEDAKASSFGSSAVCSAESDGGTYAKILVSFDDDGMRLTGDRFESACSLRPLKEDERERYWTRGIVARASLRDAVPLSDTSPLSLPRAARRQAIEAFQATEDDGGNVLAALACGYKEGISEDGTYDAFKACGLAHVVAVSGAHLAIVASMIALGLSSMRFPRSLSVIIILLFILAYLAFSGLPISALRAATMVALSMTAFAFKRRRSSLSALAFCIIAFIAMDPWTALSVSFFLSTSSTLGIVMFSSLFASWFEVCSKMVSQRVFEPLALTLAASLPTQPYSAALFSQLPLIAPLANVLVAPFFALSCIAALLTAVLSVCVADCSDIFVQVGSMACLPLTGIVDLVSTIPYGCVPFAADATMMVVLSCAICAMLWMTWPKLSVRSFLFGTLSVFMMIAVFSLFSFQQEGDEVMFLDVGQGDASLLMSDGASLLVDTGTNDSMLMKEMSAAGMTRLDAVLITHPDDDHCGSLVSLSRCVEIGSILLASDLESCPCSKCAGLLNDLVQANLADRIEWVKAGDEICVGNFTLNVVWPDRFEEQGGNADSICFFAHLDCDADGIDDWTLLFTGDAESEQLMRMQEEGKIEDVDVLKVGHHGSRVSLDESIVKALDPEIALIGVGARNRYGHPTRECLSYLEGVDCNVFRTDEDGTITLRYDVSTIRVDTQRGDER